MSGTARLKQRLYDQIEARQDELVSLAADLIRFNTENPPGNSQPITDHIASFLTQGSVTLQRLRAPGGHHNLLAEISMAKPGRRLWFCGHTDVVPVGDTKHWAFPPFAGDIHDGYLRGRGASDMKAGLAGFLFAAHLLDGLSEELTGSIGLMIVDDEETGGENGARWVLDQHHVQGDGCIIAEPSEPLHPTIGQKGSCWMQATFHGESGHGSIAPLSGKNAILVACAAAQQLQKLYDIPVTTPADVEALVARTQEHLRARDRGQVANIIDHVSVNIGTVRGGSKVNIVPDECEIEIDTRVPFGLTNEDVYVSARRLLDELGYDYTLEPIGFQSIPNFTSPDSRVVQTLVANVAQVRGGETYGVLQWASSDARFFRAHGIPVAQYGPAELETIHGVNERVRAVDIVDCCKVYAGTAVDFLVEPQVRSG